MDQSAQVRAVLAERNIQRQALGQAIGISRRRIYGLLASQPGFYWRASERAAVAAYLGMAEASLFPSATEAA